MLQLSDRLRAHLSAPDPRALMVNGRWVVAGTLIATVGLVVSLLGVYLSEGVVLQQVVAVIPLTFIGYVLARLGWYRWSVNITVTALYLGALGEFFWVGDGALRGSTGILVLLLVFIGLLRGKRLVAIGAVAGAVVPPLGVWLGGAMGWWPGMDVRGVSLAVINAVVMFGTYVLIVMYRATIEQAIADRDRVATELVEREANLSSIMATTLVPLMSTDDEGRVLAANTAAASLFGRPRETLLGTSITTLLPDWSPGSVRSRVSYPRRLSGVAHDGRRFPVEIAAAPYERDGKRFETIAIRDLTAQFEAESQLSALARQAGMAEVAVDMLHNVGNTLQSMMASTHAMQEGLAEMPVAKLEMTVARMAALDGSALADWLANDAQGQVALPLLAALAEQLAQQREGLQRELERVDSKITHIGRVVANQPAMASRNIYERCEPARLVQEAVDFVRGALDQTGVALTVACATRGEIRTDRHRVMQILVNLLRNAVDAMEGGPDRRLEIAVASDGDAVRFAVTDTGCGIDGGTMRRLFEHGFSTKAGGHGFGLHGCALNAQALHGTLKVASDGPGRGATFTLTIPVDSQALDG